MDAKAKGGKVKKRPNWDRMKVDVMLDVVRSKFSRDANLQQKLLSTKNQHIVEGHTGDKFWGGKANHLGNILMRVREELRVSHGSTATQTVMEQDDDDDAHSKCKARSKGNDDRQSQFQDQLKAWVNDTEACNQSFEETSVEVRLALEKQDIAAVGAHSSDAIAEHQLASGFMAWLRSTLEDFSDVDVECLMCGVEVILDAPEDLSEALENVSDMLSQENVMVSKAELEVQWGLLC
jgi:hypothetical protein